MKSFLAVLQPMHWNPILLETSPALVASTVLSEIKDIHLWVGSRKSIFPRSWAEGLELPKQHCDPLRPHGSGGATPCLTQKWGGALFSRAVHTNRLWNRVAWTQASQNPPTNQQKLAQEAEHAKHQRVSPLPPFTSLYFLSHKIRLWKNRCLALEPPNKWGRGFPVSRTISKPFKVPNLSWALF